MEQWTRPVHNNTGMERLHLLGEPINVEAAPLKEDLRTMIHSRQQELPVLFLCSYQWFESSDTPERKVSLYRIYVVFSLIRDAMFSRASSETLRKMKTSRVKLVRNYLQLSIRLSNTLYIV
ncbi:hypothetical protein CBL_12412 [Carabus blaptoides fortunei]